eukprot:CAMPEP_0119323364 /NCGR_PEP_ID=MMETSP1333-20130426/60526_1 /TAXON_ID=418940 /ORGANISM="Scyphosphaera apsteinii, Strain RCC1455" /LENGTH=82 /DNA_ID=CAMNT_0007330787 /DNA_START=389 /DNA_END=637 /DNA_ORIENTATION=+
MEHDEAVVPQVRWEASMIQDRAYRNERDHVWYARDLGVKVRRGEAVLTQSLCEARAKLRGLSSRKPSALSWQRRHNAQACIA